MQVFQINNATPLVHPLEIPMYFRIIIAALSLGGMQPMAGYAASFDCAQATSALEKTICTDVQLSKADEEMSKLFTKLRDTRDAGQSKALLKDQRSWLKQRTDRCTTVNVPCLIKLYNERIDVLRATNENIVPFVLDDPLSFQGIRGTCVFNELNLSENYALYAAGEYAGRKLDIQIDQSGHQATQFDVIVNSTDKPVVLLLGAC